MCEEQKEETYKIFHEASVNKYSRGQSHKKVADRNYFSVDDIFHVIFVLMSVSVLGQKIIVVGDLFWVKLATDQGVSSIFDCREAVVENSWKH